MITAFFIVGLLWIWGYRKSESMILLNFRGELLEVEMTEGGF